MNEREVFLSLMKLSGHELYSLNVPPLERKMIHMALLMEVLIDIIITGELSTVKDITYRMAAKGALFASSEEYRNNIIGATLVMPNETPEEVRYGNNKEGGGKECTETGAEEGTKTKGCE